MQPHEKGPRRKALRRTEPYQFRVREHHGWGHGLRPGTTSDLVCTACKRERAEGLIPVISETPAERLLRAIFEDPERGL